MEHKYIRFTEDYRNMHFNGPGDAYDYCIATGSYDTYKKGSQFKIIRRANNDEGWLIRVKQTAVYIDDWMVRDKIVVII